MRDIEKKTRDVIQILTMCNRYNFTHYKMNDPKNELHKRSIEDNGLIMYLPLRRLTFHTSPTITIKDPFKHTDYTSLTVATVK